MAGASDTSQVEVKEEELLWTKPLGGPRSLHPSWAGGGGIFFSKMPGRHRGIPETFSWSCESPAGQGLPTSVSLFFHGWSWVTLTQEFEASAQSTTWLSFPFTAMNHALSTHQCPITGQQFFLKWCVLSSWLQELICQKIYLYTLNLRIILTFEEFFLLMSFTKFYNFLNY